MPRRIPRPAILVAAVVVAAIVAIAIARGGVLGGSSSDFAKIPPAKQTFQAQVNAEDTAAAAIPPAAKDPNHTLPTLDPPQPVPTGIIEHPNSFMHYTFQNEYQQVVGDRFIQVYAGADQDDLSQGLVVVHNNSRTDLADTSGQTYHTAEKTGSLRIVSGDLNSLNLTSTDGTAYTFDATNGVLSRSSPTTAVATAVSTSIPLGGASAP